MPELEPLASLAGYQTYVARLEQERGFADQGVLEKCLLMGEEVGELFKAIRKAEHIAIDETARVGGVAEELADVLIFICSIANRYNIDLEQAFRDKEDVNKTRRWTR